MPYKEKKVEKLFYTIGEVAKMFDVNHSTIRYWENEFDILKPKKNNKGNRMFTPADIENLHVIYYLLKKQGLTLKGTKKRLQENKEGTFRSVELIKRLEYIKDQLNELKSHIS
ncbi:MAG: MerR family transcriptional regulator [Bacteroidota bacterium]|nr:MerR family transcriptional regulator [Bacteroidota bacterium]